MRVATQNIWFSPHEWERRLDALFTSLSTEQVDLLCMQEVTPRVLQRLQKELIRDGTWHLLTSESLREPPAAQPHVYGVALLSRHPLDEADELQLPSDMGRSLLSASVSLPGRPSLRVGTVHLESTRFMRSVRERQLQLIGEHLSTTPDTLICGDFNFDAGAAEELYFPAGFTELWSTLRPQDSGYTEDTSRNKMRLLEYGKKKQVRYDRMLLGPGTWRPSSISLFADAPINAEGTLCVSDHFGVMADLES